MGREVAHFAFYVAAAVLWFAVGFLVARCKATRAKIEGRWIMTHWETFWMVYVFLALALPVLGFLAWTD